MSCLICVTDFLYNFNFLFHPIFTFKESNVARGTNYYKIVRLGEGLVHIIRIPCIFFVYSYLFIIYLF